MQVTEVRIKLMEDPGDRLKAFCSVTFDNCFVVRDLKIIEGSSGPFVAMPSRKLTAHCPQCGTKNHLRALHCNSCGVALPSDRSAVDDDGRAKLYADIAHPINSSCREMIQQHVIEEYHQERERSKQPGYVSKYDEFDLDVEESTTFAKGSSPDKRIDQPHQRRGTHAGGPGGDFRPSRPSKSPSGKPALGKKDSFGAGIFGEDNQ